MSLAKMFMKIWSFDLCDYNRRSIKYEVNAISEILAFKIYENGHMGPFVRKNIPYNTQHKSSRLIIIEYCTYNTVT